jgi:hypothetical protein
MASDSNKQSVERDGGSVFVYVGQLFASRPLQVGGSNARSLTAQLTANGAEVLYGWELKHGSLMGEDNTKVGLASSEKWLMLRVVFAFRGGGDW